VRSNRGQFHYFRGELIRLGSSYNLLSGAKVKQHFREGTVKRNDTPGWLPKGDIMAQVVLDLNRGGGARHNRYEGESEEQGEEFSHCRVFQVLIQLSPRNANQTVEYNPRQVGSEEKKEGFKG